MQHSAFQHDAFQVGVPGAILGVSADIAETDAARDQYAQQTGIPRTQNESAAARDDYQQLLSIVKEQADTAAARDVYELLVAIVKEQADTDGAGDSYAVAGGVAGATDLRGKFWVWNGDAWQAGRWKVWNGTGWA